VLILGCGNPDRSDDAAGLLVARRLRELGIDAHEAGGGGLALIDAWSGWADVIVVDAVMSGAPPGTITIWDARTSAFPVGQFRCSTHALGVAEAIELARALDRLPSKLIVFGIEGVRFDPGEPPSAEVADAVERLARHIAKETNMPMAAPAAES
jgi:hydrogenase maturation protease